MTARFFFITNDARGTRSPHTTPSGCCSPIISSAPTRNEENKENENLEVPNNMCNILHILRACFLHVCIIIIDMIHMG